LFAATVIADVFTEQINDDDDDDEDRTMKDSERLEKQ